jgi:Putative MetA-pathway of phenol degradation
MSINRTNSRCSTRTLFLLLIFTVSKLWAQGPPYQTDDPVPVDLHHYEFYIFGSVDGTTAEIDSSGPALEFNWGAIPRVQLHAILPWGGVFPSNNPVYLPGGTGPSAFGLIDTELGVKLAIIKETKHFPQIGTFTMFEIPTGSYDKGLGVGKVWYKLPVWLQKNSGKWLFDGGGGYQVVPQANYRDFPYTGWLVKRELNERLELGAELFAHGREGFAAAQTGRSAMIDVGGYYHFKHHPGQQFLFCYGHSIAGQTENYAYAGMYWTWGKDDKDDKDDKKDTAGSIWMQGPGNGNGFQ